VGFSLLSLVLWCCVGWIHSGNHLLDGLQVEQLVHVQNRNGWSAGLAIVLTHKDLSLDVHAQLPAQILHLYIHFLIIGPQSHHLEHYTLGMGLVHPTDMRALICRPRRVWVHL
jgi:hypothetical protein